MKSKSLSITIDFFPGILLAALLVGCTTTKRATPSASDAVRAALDQQVREWNAGNLAGFMETYAKSEETRFASGGDISRGWQTVFDRYHRKYGDRAAMGALTFSDLEITQLGPNTALAFGRWRLKREKDNPNGLFTLVFQKTKDDWRIVHDHTSTATKD